MPRKPKFETEVPTKPGRGRRTDAALPAVRGGAAVAAKHKAASEAPTEPPPAPEEEVPVSVPKHQVKLSGVRPKRTGAAARAATVDEVTADMTNDPRRDDDD